MPRGKSNRAGETGNSNSAPSQQQAEQHSGGNGNGGSNRASANADLDPQQVAARAYEIYMREGGVHGRDMDHWLRAEEELRSEQQGRPGSEARPGSAAASEQNTARSARQHQAV